MPEVIEYEHQQRGPGMAYSAVVTWCAGEYRRKDGLV